MRHKEAIARFFYSGARIASALAMVALIPLATVTITTGASAQGGAAPIHGKISFDVAPGAAAQGLTLGKQYRDAARALTGNFAVTLLQEIDRPHKFSIHEGWNDQAAYDASQTTATLTALRDGLKALGSAPLDRRDFEVISVGPARPATGGDTIYMDLHLDVFPPGIDRTIAAAKLVAEAARKDDGNLRFDVFKSVKAPVSHFTILTAWRNRAAFDAYESSAWGRQFRDSVGPLLGSPFDDRLKVSIN